MALNWKHCCLPPLKSYTQSLLSHLPVLVIAPPGQKYQTAAQLSALPALIRGQFNFQILKLSTFPKQSALHTLALHLTPSSCWEEAMQAGSGC